MIEYSVSSTSVGPTSWVRLDTKGPMLHVYHVAIVIDNEGAAEATLEMAIERDFTTATPICHSILQDITSTTASVVHAPLAGVRLNVTRVSTGATVTLKVLQS